MGKSSRTLCACSKVLFLVAILSGLLIRSGIPPSVADPVLERQVLKLWQAGSPGAEGNNPDLDVPTLTVCRPRPKMATGASVAICPGGG